MGTAAATLHHCFDTLADVSGGVGGDMGEVLAVAVIHEHGVRAVAYARAIGLARPGACSEQLATLGDLMHQARNGGLN